MEKSSILSVSTLHEIEFVQESGNNQSIFISSNDGRLFDNFITLYNEIIKLADKFDKELNDAEKLDGVGKILKISTLNVEFSEKSMELIDNVFGEGTLQKYFADIFDKIPTFLPDAECVIDFLENIMPEMEKIFDRKADGLKERREKMAKYKPQDHKKKSK